MSFLLTDVGWNVYDKANKLLGMVLAEDENGAMDQAKAWFGDEAASVRRTHE